MKILIDNGHGNNTPGKRSPLLDDGTRYYEWEYTRKVAKEVVRILKAENYDAELLTPEDWDVSITNRILRANKHCKTYGSKNVVLVSIHSNAIGMDDKWRSAEGWQVCISLNASSSSKRLATIFADKAGELALKVRKPSVNEAYWKQNIGICRATNCPSVLTENLFHSNKHDVEFLMSQEGFNKIVQLHVESIKSYIQFT